MKDRQARESARRYFVPFILGNSARSHRIALRIYLKYGIIPIICDQRRSFIGALSPICRYLRLSQADEPCVIAQQLISLSEQQPYTLPIIIPVTEKYSDAVEAEKSTLEQSFVIADLPSLFSSSPLANIP